MITALAFERGGSEAEGGWLIRSDPGLNMPERASPPETPTPATPQTPGGTRVPRADLTITFDDGSSVESHGVIPVWWRRAVLPSLPWVVRFLSFFFVCVEKFSGRVRAPTRVRGSVAMSRAQC